MDIERELAGLVRRVRELEDREEIRNVIASYGPAVDRGDSSAAAGLWAVDGTYDVDGYGISAGRAAIKALLDGPHHRQLIAGGAAHLLSPVKLEIVGDDAIAVGYSCVFQWNGEAFNAVRIAANRWTLGRSRSGWQVTGRTNRLLNGSEAAQAILQIQNTEAEP